MKKIFVAALFALSFSACAKAQNGFPKKETLKFGKLCSWDNKVGWLAATDSFLVVCNNGGGSVLSFINLNTQKKAFDKVSYGSNFGQIITPFFFGVFQGSIVWVRDLNGDKVLAINLGKDFKSDNPAYTQYELNEAHSFYNIAWLGDGVIIGNGDNTSEKILQKADLKTDSLIAGFGEYNDAPKGETALEWKVKHEGFLFQRPSGDKVAMALRYTDQLEIYDLNKLTRDTIVKGPDNIRLDMGYLKEPGTMDRYVAATNDNTTYSYVAGAVTNSYIYLLYSGANVATALNSPHRFYGSKMYVYDWKGNAVAELKLDRDVSTIAVSKDNSTIYAVDPNNNSIIKASVHL